MTTYALLTLAMVAVGAAQATTSSAALPSRYNTATIQPASCGSNYANCLQSEEVVGFCDNILSDCQRMAMPSTSTSSDSQDTSAATRYNTATIQPASCAAGYAGCLKTEEVVQLCDGILSHCQSMASTSMPSSPSSTSASLAVVTVTSQTTATAASAPPSASMSTTMAASTSAGSPTLTPTSSIATGGAPAVGASLSFLPMILVAAFL